MTARIIVSFIVMAIIMLAIAILIPVGTRFDYLLIPIGMAVFCGCFWILGGLTK